MPEVFIHLGVHKTATTFTQHILFQNQKELRVNGVGFTELPQVRGTLTNHLKNEPYRHESCEPFLSSLRNFDRIIISDENILGSCVPVQGVDIYPDGDRYVSRLRSVLQSSHSHFERVWFVALRSYPDFFTSAYCEFLRHNNFVTQREYLAKLNWRKFHWGPLLEKIRNAIGDDRLVIADFSDFHKNPLAHANFLSGNPLRNAPAMDASIQRSTITRKDWNAYHAEFRNNGRAAAQEIVAQDLSNNFSRGGEKISLFSSIANFFLKRRYIQEISQMRKTLEFL